MITVPEPVSLTGVYLKIRHLKQVGPDHYRAYDAERGFLLDVDETGAEQILNSDMFRVRVTRLATPSERPERPAR